MLIQVSETVRIESHPPRRRAVATAELLDDAVTAGHYQPPRRATADEIADPNIPTEGEGASAVRLFFDAMGKPIRLGEEMDYIDWKVDDDGHDFSVYQLTGVDEVDKDGNTATVDRYLPVGTPHDTLEQAMQAANQL